VAEGPQSDGIFHVNHARRDPQGEAPEEMVGAEWQVRRIHRTFAQRPTADPLLKLDGTMERELRDADQRVFSRVDRPLMDPIVSATI
jgi:hypothetical protein